MEQDGGTMDRLVHGVSSLRAGGDVEVPRGTDDVE